MRISALAGIFLLLVGTSSADAREVTVSLWISGGAEGLLDGGRVAPGWLGLLSQLGDRPAHEPWVDVGGSRHLPELDAVEGGRGPEAIVPGESLLRIRGVSGLSSEGIPWVLSNAGVFPQFPGALLPLASEWRWRHPDGARIRVQGLLSDRSPLTVPADRLRPMQVLPAVETVRASYLKSHQEDVLEILVLPEGADGSEWSTLIPDADIVVEPATGAASVVEVAQGSRIRVRPGKFGRSILRVWARWDTVTKTFSSANAEVVWVSECDYSRLKLPPGLAERVRMPPQESFPEEIDVVWEPEMDPIKESTRRPEGIRAQQIPEDDAWMRVRVPAERWSDWRSVEGARWNWRTEAEPRSPWVALPAWVVAGRGNWDCPIRQDFVQGKVNGTWLPGTTRSLFHPDRKLLP